MIQLHLGDNKLILPTLPENSVDSIVCDPPYELSNDGKASAYGVFSEFMFPEHPKFKAVLPTELNFSFLLSEILDLSRVRSLPCVAATMPESAMTFDYPVEERNKVIEYVQECTVRSANGLTVEQVNTQTLKRLANSYFKLADFAKLFEVFDEIGCGFYAGGIGIGFGIDASSFPSLLHHSSSVIFTHNDVRLLNNALSEFVSAGGRAKDFFVSRFDLSRGTIEFNSTYAALALFASLELAGAQLVTTLTRASCLPAVFEPSNISFVSPVTNRALSIYLVVHKLNIQNSGFMGKDWDGSKIAFDVELWKMCLRVLKPGGHLLAFGGSRTYHRLACAIEDAGFEIRDQIMWLYGCLSEDSEVLTEQGFMTYEQIRKSKNIRIFTYDKGTDSYGLEQPERWNEYQIKDTCYRIESDSTDQIVSRNHRCLVEREGDLVFEFAEDVAQERQARIPILESLSALQSAISGTNERAGNAEPELQQVLLKGVNWTEQCQAKNDTKENAGDSLRGLRQESHEARLSHKENRQANLQLSMQRRSSGPTVGHSCPQSSAALVGSQRTGAEGTNDGRNEPILEGRNNVSTQKGILRRGFNKIRSLSTSFFANGPKRWLRNGISFGHGPITESVLEALRSSASYRPQSNEQCGHQLDAVCQQQRPQKVRVGPTYQTTLATFTPVDYDGLVFCPTVSTGAFIARRNGKVFLTGNSGFPKSLDISKAFDKAAGANREVVGKYQPPNGKVWDLTNDQSEPGYSGGLGKRSDSLAITAPQSDLAKQWDGWGTALKPAHEPICVARKPFKGTIINNVSQFGTGGLNIDACRVEFASESDIKSATWGRGTDIMGGQFVGGFAPTGETNIEANPKGRFPANVIHDGSKEVFEAFNSFGTKTSGKPIGKKKAGNNVYGEYGTGIDITGYGDSGSAARFFYCAKADKKDRNEGCKSLPDRKAGMNSNTSGQHITRRDEGYKPAPVKNNHPTVKPTALMEYLCELITPPGGTVLDNFMGSGTTGKAAAKKGFSFIGIENRPDAFAIAEARINHAYAKYKLQLTVFPS